MLKMFNLNDYVSGSRMNYSSVVTGADSSHLSHISNISVEFDDGEIRHGYEVFDTYPIDISSFYRFSID